MQAEDRREEWKMLAASVKKIRHWGVLTASQCLTIKHTLNLYSPLVVHHADHIQLSFFCFEYKP